MHDLLGDEIQMTASRSLLQSDHGFDDFWQAWPRGDRRVGKPQAKAKWVKLGCANNALHIIAHVEYLKTTEQWQTPKLVPLVCTYLNQQRWLDWEPPAPKPVQKTRTEEYIEHKKKCVPPSAEIREKMAQLRK